MAFINFLSGLDFLFPAFDYCGGGDVAQYGLRFGFSSSCVSVTKETG